MQILGFKPKPEKQPRTSVHYLRLQELFQHRATRIPSSKPEALKRERVFEPPKCWMPPCAVRAAAESARESAPCWARYGLTERDSELQGFGRGVQDFEGLRGRGFRGQTSS